uniref:Uncharacterized protein n=1 Tax=Tanacetum cinerariifolium TaxID=118510 RepID=A0A6L2LKU9_TANCI|nr:hypothetical protein [Tanacetum cinerariifolium]
MTLSIYEVVSQAESIQLQLRRPRESARDVYSKHRIITITELQIAEWHNYKHLDWITIRKDDDKLYKFKEGDFKRLCIQDIEDMLLLLVQGKNKDKQNGLMRIDELHKFSDGTLNDVRTAIDDHLKGIWMQYLPQTIWRRSDKDRAAAMIRAIDKQLKTKRIMQSLEKFVGGRLYEGDFRMLQRTIDGTLDDVRTALDDRLKGIWMQYLPHTIWRRSDKDRAATMISVIDNQLKTKRIMQSLENFVGGRLYEGDFRMLQRTI